MRFQDIFFRLILPYYSISFSGIILKLFSLIDSNQIYNLYYFHGKQEPHHSYQRCK